MSEIIFAFIGVFINVMPCNFSTLLLRIRYIVSGPTLKGRLPIMIAQAAGIHATILSLAVIAIAIATTGSKVIWGNLLSGSNSITVMSVILFVIGFHHLFPMHSSKISHHAGKLADKIHVPEFTPTVIGAFTSGCISVLLSLECNGPILAAILSNKLVLADVAKSIVLSQVFAAGVSMPLLVLGSIPVLTKLLPKPGKWMEFFQGLAGIPLLIIAGMGLLTLIERGEYVGSFIVLVSVLSMFLHNFLYRFMRLLHATMVTSAVAIAMIAILSSTADTNTIYTKYTPQKLSKLVLSHKPVLFIISSDMCLHCKLNSIRVAHNNKIQTMVRGGDLTILYARFKDGNKDGELIKLLSSFDQKYVPLNILYDAKGRHHIISGLLTNSDIDKIMTIIYD